MKYIVTWSHAGQERTTRVDAKDVYRAIDLALFEIFYSDGWFREDLRILEVARDTTDQPIEA